MKVGYLYYLISFTLIIGLFSCANDVHGKLESKPVSFGQANDVTILCDDALWEGDLGDTIKYYYAAAYPITPSPEPIFNLKHYNPNQLKKVRVLTHRRIYVVMANLADKDSPTTQMVIKDMGEAKYQQALEDPSFNSIVGKNKWANGQIIIYLFAKNSSDLVDVVKNKFPDVSSRIYEHDFDQIKATAYAAGDNVILNNDIRKLYKLDVRIPKRFVMAKLNPEDESMWIRRDDKESIQNIAFLKIPYTNEKQFSLDSIITYLERFGAKNIEDDKILINDSDLPTYEFNRSREGLYVKEVRGIWEAERKFQGGPYIAHVVYPENAKDIIIMYSFLYAPSIKKRDIMQQLEVIMESAKTFNEAQ